MTTTPGRAVTAMTVLVITIAIPAMLIVVGQREQEVVTVTSPSIMVPLTHCITTDQAACRKLEYGNSRAFAITTTMEGRSACTVNAALVAQGPILFRRSSPGIDLSHLSGVQQRTTLKVFIALNRACSVVTTVATSTYLRATTIGISSIRTLVTVATITVVLARCTSASTHTVASTLTTVGTSHVLGPVVTSCIVSTDLNVIDRTAIGIGSTLITEGRDRTTIGVVLHTTNATSCLRTPRSIFQALLRTSVNGRCCTTSHAVVIGLAVIGTLTVTTTEATTGTSKGAIITGTANAMSFTVVTCLA